MSKLITFVMPALLITCAGAYAQAPPGVEKLTVLEDRAKPNGRRIELAYLRLKASGTQPGSLTWTAALEDPVSASIGLRSTRSCLTRCEMLAT